jgi:single-strand DNA-binding protein
MAVNKVILVGNVGKDPVVRYFDKGVAKATFPLATSEIYTNQQGETITSTEWHNIVLWRALAEVAEKTIKKGSQVYVVGKIKTRSYVDREGNNKYITEILADTLLLLNKRQPQTNQSSQEEGNKEVRDTSSSDTVVNEPDTKYPTDREDNNSDWPGNENSNGSGADSLNTNGSDTGQDEDDLPF